MSEEVIVRKMSATEVNKQIRQQMLLKLKYQNMLHQVKIRKEEKQERLIEVGVYQNWELNMKSEIFLDYL